MRASGRKSILIIIVARIGDTLFVTPAVRALRKCFPDARIDVLAHPGRISVLENNQDINMLLCNNIWGRFRLLPRLNNRYDMVFVYGEDIKLLKYGRSIGKYVIGFKHGIPSVDRLMDIAVPRPLVPMHAVDERLLLPAAAGTKCAEKKLVYCVRKEEKSWADSFMKKNGIGVNDIVIGFQIAGFPTKAYRDWPVEKFISLGRHIMNKYKAKILLFGSGKEVKKAKEIRNALGGNSVIAAGRTSIRQAAALISGLNAFVTTDTGPMHIAFALEVPTVALFHCMHPARYLGPLHNIDRFTMIQMTPPLNEECGRHLALDSISSDMVWKEIQKMIGDKL
ncbi:MAG: glycosyltransferase family 9 protein [Thermodesulfovibrionia bacterium]|nr:glycosyltransferase family 9 protein [Thermodesulfovibrionia bacterium]